MSAGSKVIDLLAYSPTELEFMVRLARPQRLPYLRARHWASPPTVDIVIVPSPCWYTTAADPSSSASPRSHHDPQAEDTIVTIIPSFRHGPLHFIIVSA